MKQWIVAFFALFLAVGTSCKDELTLDEAGMDVYLTITPDNPTITFGVDTLQMMCEVKSHSGKPVVADVEWSSDDPASLRFIEGTNKLVAELAGVGKTVKVRAKLSNGRYALTNVTITGSKAEKLELLFMEVNKGEKEVVDKDGTKRKETVYSSSQSFIGENLTLPVGGSLEFVVKATPASALSLGDVVIEGLDPALATLEKLELDPEADKGKIAVTPAGTVWYRLKSNGVRGASDVTFRAPGKAGMETKLNLRFGTKLDKIGLNADKLDVVEESAVLNLNQEVEVNVYAEIIPSQQEDLDAIEAETTWSINSVTGGGGSFVTKPTIEKTQGAGIRLKTKVKAGLMPGSFSVTCVIQGKTVSKSFTVIDRAQVPFEKIVFDGKDFDDLYAGETKRLRINILPKTSHALLLEELQLSYTTPGIAEHEPTEGLYSVRGLKAGETELVATLRGQQFKLPIKVKPAPKAVIIDGSTPNVLMLGDQVVWSADVQMEGGDQPVWSNLKWTIADTKYVQFVGTASGKSVKIKAAELTEDGKEIDIVADYRGKTSKRGIKVVPLQSSVVLSSDLIDLDQAGVTRSNGAILLELTSKDATKQPSMQVILKPKNGTANSIQAKTYTGQEYEVSVVWSALNLRKVAVDSSSVVLVSAGGKYNATLNITMMVDGKPITVTGTLNGLEEY